MAFLRQPGIVSPEALASLSVTIIGTGAIGSFTALTLAKMGVKKLILYDPDSVELHNLSNQFFASDAIGSSKCEITAKECLRQSPDGDLDIATHSEAFDGTQSLDSDIIIAVTDNIEGRAAAYKTSRSNPQCQLFIDARMSAELVRIFALKRGDLRFHDKYLKDFIEGVENSEEPCTARSIIYNVLLAASLISSHVKKFVTGEVIPFEFSFAFKNLYQVKTRMEVDENDP